MLMVLVKMLQVGSFIDQETVWRRVTIQSADSTTVITDVCIFHTEPMQDVPDSI